MNVSAPVPTRVAWLKSPTSACAPLPLKTGRAWRLVLLGAPGVGKGTQAELLEARLGACHLSTGDVFRAAKSLPEVERSPAMTEALGYMKRGELVPDATVVAVIRERVRCLHCPSGFLLDGFPRTVGQAEVLAELLKQEHIALDAVLDYQLPIEEIVARLSGRRTCGECKAVFHVTGRPPKQEGICDTCSGALVQREDDMPEAVRVRMAVYHKSTEPLVVFYKEQGLLVEIESHGSPEEILQRTMAVLTARK